LQTINSGSHCEYYHAQIDNPENPNQAGTPYEANCEDIIKALGLTFDEGCEFKSIWRRGRARQGFVKEESNALRDAAKAVHYAGRVLRTEEQKASVLDTAHSESDGQEFVSRYDWSVAPEWARFAATDFSGDIFWYSERPRIDEGEACWGLFGCGRSIVTTQADHEACAVWRNTLETRP
jgi:hypothetical protein